MGAKIVTIHMFYSISELFLTVIHKKGSDISSPDKKMSVDCKKEDRFSNLLCFLDN